ncbi:MULTISPECIES: hypothetical protein [Burkholderia]|uniref:hypothetical protein n=1 Tax=Burkholderia TaxID=32008 RepID=UPI00164060C4|nr:MULTISPECIES: hypothetical protein [Burkholderia]
MRRITISVPESTAEALKQLTSYANTNVETTTHGRLTVPLLLGMLAEDAAMVVTRPGCWEASNMSQVLYSHGYRV